MINYTLEELLKKGLLTEEMLELNPTLKAMADQTKKYKEIVREESSISRMKEKCFPIVTKLADNTIVDAVDCESLEEIFALYEKNIGEYVYLKDKINDYLASTAVSICRRRFKKKDILMMILLDEDNDYEGEAGIAFTDKALYYWLEGDDFKCEIKYMDIENVDFDEDSITVETKDGMSYEVLCDGDEEERCSRYLYNMVMDVKELVEE